MDLFMQLQANENEVYEFISKQREAMDGQAVDSIMRTETFSIESLEAQNRKGRMDFRQSLMLSDYKFNKKRYERELWKLEKNNNTAEGMIAFYEKLIQIEQNDMKMRLLMASVLDRGTAAKRVRAESLEKIRTYRQVLLEQYYKLAQKGQMTERWNELSAEYAREEAAYQEAAAELDLRVLTTAALDRIKTERDDAERTGTEDTAALIQEFLDADFSTRTLGAGYVIQNMNACLHNVELIRRMRRAVFMGDDEAKVIRKLKAVSEYANVVDSALWEYGFTIDHEALQIREIGKNDEAFARKRQAYLENGAVNFYLSVRRYKHGEGGAEADDAHGQGTEQTRVEEKLSALEAKLKIADAVGQDEHIMRAATRSVSAVQTAKAGDTIRAAKEEAEGKREHLKVKDRLGKIYAKLKERLTAKLGEGAEEFQDLQPLVDAYVQKNRKVYENRAEVEQFEASALVALKRALVRVQKSVLNKCSKYAAILLGLLAGESSGYLEVPLGKKHFVGDEKIILGDKRKPGKAAEREYQDCTSIPLFTHRPNIKDVAQGDLGDCYLLAGLLSVVDQNAEEIMNIMKDNGDGTVTVCFKREETDASGKTSFTPCYVTVRKTVPVLKANRLDAFSSGALWVKMIEKAYAASGLHIIDRINAENARNGILPVSYDQLQNDIVMGTRKMDYDDIWGGWPGPFVSLLLGRKSDEHNLNKNRAEHVGDRIGRMLPAVNEPAWNADPARKFGNESVDSIVYEYIRKQDLNKAGEFLDLKKLEAPQRNDDRLMAEYRAKKEALQKYRRTCILNLDIVDSIAREGNLDILQLDSEAKIRQFYDTVKDIFLRSLNGTATGLYEKYKDVIVRVVNNYVTDDFGTLFLPIQVQQFNDTVDILQERHIELLKKNLAGGTGVGAGKVAGAPQNYYSARDLKLFGRIETALQSGSYVDFVTRILSATGTGRNGESEASGMVGTHVYSIINTRKVTVNGQERLYFVVMNPWAYKGVVYHVEADGIKEHAVDGIDDEEGVFCLELRRFAEIVKQWDAVPA